MKADPAAPGLIFSWPRPEGFSFLLFGCVVASLCAHGLTFFLFQVAEPPGTTIAHASPQVSLLTPSSPEAIALLHWIEAQDPALVAAASSVTPAGLPDVPYRPSYATVRTAPLGPVETPVQVPFPAVRDPLAMIASAEGRRAPRAATRTAQPTAAEIPGHLAARLASPLPPLVPGTRATEPVEPTRHLIGVTGRGEVRLIFLQDSSGHAALDEQAAMYWQKLAFPPGDAPITWAMVSITWGDDAYGENPQSETRNPKKP